MLRVPSSEQINLRLSSLTSTLQALQGRASVVETFGNAEELEEIGLLTMRMAALEELLALFCETLLIRPEMGGFHTSSKAVITKQFGEKVSLYSALSIACGVLHGIDTQSIEGNLAVLKALGEERNAIIHGLLSGAAGKGQPAFRSRGHAVPANLLALRDLTARCHDAASEFISQFSSFYAELVRKKSTGSRFDVLMPTVLETALQLHHSQHTLRTATLNLRAFEKQLSEATEKRDESLAQLAASKEALRTAKARQRRGNKTAAG